MAVLVNFFFPNDSAFKPHPVLVVDCTSNSKNTERKYSKLHKRELETKLISDILEVEVSLKFVKDAVR